MIKACVNVGRVEMIERTYSSKEMDLGYYRYNIVEDILLAMETYDTRPAEIADNTSLNLQEVIKLLGLDDDADYFEEDVSLKSLIEVLNYFNIGLTVTLSNVTESEL